MNVQERPVPQTPKRYRFTGAATLLLMTACSSGGGGGNSLPSTVPNFGAATFSNSTVVNNPNFTLTPGEATTLVEETPDGSAVIVVEVLDTTRVVNGVTCVVVRDRVFEDELLIEDTHDWYAQDDAGNVWYMGEEVDNYEYDDDGNLLGMDHEGAWEAGKDVAGVGSVAHPGWIMKANPKVGDRYHQEYYRGQAEDFGSVLDLAAAVTLSDGSTYTCIKTHDTSTLDTASEEKYFAPGVGLVFEEDLNSPQTLERTGAFVPGPDSVPDFDAAVFTDPTVIDNSFFSLSPDRVLLYLTGIDDQEAEHETTVVELLEETRVVAGVTCAVVRDHVYLEGLLLEDTFDWFAQDDDGNVWYMGEEVVNYEYDDDGNLIGTDNDGSWEAGLDVAGTGTIAEPGYQMRAAPMPGDAYHQEYYEDEAVDMAAIVRTDASVEITEGIAFDDCLQVLEWNPLEPGALEYKYASSGIGVVAEEGLHDGSGAGLVGQFFLGDGALPDFGSATFTNPTVVDNPRFPLTVGRIMTYESETEDGLETVVETVLATTRTILGVDCVIVNVAEDVDGLLMEDTFDWYAQDDDGNVWYMGEDVTNYEYDDDGNLIGTNKDGSWEAGQDVAGTGTLAEAGHQMPATPSPGASYFQEFYEDEAEDMSFTVASGIDVELSDGTQYTNCLKTLEWTPLEPDGLEFKYWASGVGLVLVEGLSAGQIVELVSVLGP